MEDPDAWKIGSVAGWLVMSILGWLGSRSINRIDRMERDYVTRDDLEESLKNMREDRRIMHEENRDRLDAINDKIDEDRKVVNQIAIDVAKLAGRSHR